MASKKLGGYWQQKSRAITTQTIRIHSAAMRKPVERSKRKLDHFARFFAAQARDEPDTAGIVVQSRIGDDFPHVK